MASNLPQGEPLRRAVRWISGRREEAPETPLAALVDEATLRFDLTPRDAELLAAFYRDVRRLESAEEKS